MSKRDWCDQRCVSAEVCDLPSHNQIPNFKLTVLRTRDKLERVVFGEELQIRDDTTVTSDEVVRLEALEDVPDFDMAVCCARCEELARRIKCELKGHLTGGFEGLELDEVGEGFTVKGVKSELVREGKDSDHIVLIGDC